jgi:hypothetical protein
MIVKCPCQNCSGHIEFEADEFQPGVRAECPHCKFETLLFVPPVAIPPKQQRPGKGASRVALGVVALVALASLAVAVLLANSQRPAKDVKPTNLRPAAEAFGWKLGDKLGAQFASVVRHSTYYFHPETEMPPFSNFEIELIQDGRIYAIKAEGTASDYLDFSDSRTRLVSLLSEKYGLRQHIPKNSLGEDKYDFGTEEQTACLEMQDQKWFTLEYYDKSLRDIYYSELEAARTQEEAAKKAALKKGL